MPTAAKQAVAKVREPALISITILGIGAID